ncbi:glutaredoxin-2 [Encephalitozoon hellem]|uniref:Glutaredoxin-2 n=1 Tax=Encephalitozoon hellem TaxID=27973 RepID=A0ABY8CP14_ENCHE|nr:glutaredoxin-2 [Encephalitozoon hellem]
MLGTMKSSCLFHSVMFIVGMGITSIEALDSEKQKPVGISSDIHSSGPVMNTVPEAVRGPGVVAMLEENCNHSRELESKLKELGVPYKPLYAEDNLDVYNFMSTQGGAPLLYKDGKKVMDIEKFLKRYRANNSNK